MKLVKDTNQLKEKKGSPLRVETVLFFRWVLSVKSRGLNKKGLGKYFYLLDINYFFKYLYNIKNV